LFGGESIAVQEVDPGYEQEKKQEHPKGRLSFHTRK
jgi:hypothetical protein